MFDATNIKDVFFDLDHTLWDFESNSASAFEKILLAQKIEIPLDEFLAVYMPANFKFWKMFREEKITKDELRYQRLEYVFQKLSYTVTDSQIYALADAYIAQLSNYTALFPNAIKILDYLSPKYKLHIITNGFKEVQQKKLENAGLTKYFKNVIDAETIGVRKPNVQLFNESLALANATAETSVMIGDSLEADIQGAINAKLFALHFDVQNQANHNICPIINNLIEVKKFL